MSDTAFPAPQGEIRLFDREVAVRFDHNQMRQTELYWQWAVGTRLGYLGIVMQLTARTFVGLEAVAYGAVVSAQMAAGESPMTRHEFDVKADYAQLREAAQALIDGVMQSMPPTAKKKDEPPQA